MLSIYVLRSQVVVDICVCVWKQLRTKHEKDIGIVRPQ